MATGVTSSITSNVTYTTRYQMTTNDDTLIIQGATVTFKRDEGEIFTGEGNDTVTISDSFIIAEQEDLRLFLGSGNDTLTVRNTELSAPVRTGSGNDIVIVEGSLQTRVRINKELNFGVGNDILELVSVLENADNIDFGSSGTKMLRFNGGLLKPVQISGSTNYGTISSFTDLDVTLSGGTTGCDLTLSGEQTAITLSGNLFGTTSEKSISVSGGATTLAAKNNMRTNVKLLLSNMTLTQTNGAILEFSDHADYAVTADQSTVTLRNIVVKGGMGLTGTNTVWTVENSDFSNSTRGVDLTGGSIVFRNGGFTNFTSTAVSLTSTTMTGSKVSLTGNKGLGAMQTSNANVEITDFRANNNAFYKTVEVAKNDNVSTACIASTLTSASGGAICQSGGSMTLTSAAFSGNLVSGLARTSARIFNANNTFAARTAVASASAYASGGAICQNGGSMTLTIAAFSGNSAAVRGEASASALCYTSSEYSVTYSHYSGTAYSSSPLGYASASAFASADAGAIWQNGGIVTMNGVTFSGNTADATAFGSTFASLNADATVIASARGGAICQYGGNMTLTNAVFSGNIASANASAVVAVQEYVSSRVTTQAVRSISVPSLLLPPHLVMLTAVRFSCQASLPIWKIRNSRTIALLHLRMPPCSILLRILLQFILVIEILASLHRPTP